MSKSTLSEYLAVPLIEEEQKLIGWSKQTIDYAMHNEKAVHNHIRGIAKMRGRILSQQDVEDVNSDLMDYLYTSEDWNLTKAIERSNSKSMVTLPAYVHICTKYVTYRWLKKAYDTEKHEVYDTVKKGEDDKEISLFDTVSDDSAANMMDKILYDIEKTCESFECLRYKFGPDIFQVWFVRIKTMQLNKRDKYEEIMGVLGVSKKDMEKLKDGDMLTMAKAISQVGYEKALEILRKYVYCADRIEKIVAVA